MTVATILSRDSSVNNNNDNNVYGMKGVAGHDDEVHFSTWDDQYL